MWEIAGGQIVGRTVWDGVGTETAAWVAAVVVNGGTVSVARQTYVNNLITDLKNDGIWAKLDRLWLLAAENEPSALTDLVGLTLATANGAPSFSADLGYTGVDASTTVYIDTNTNFSTLGGHLTATAGHQSAWSNTDAASGVSGGCIVSIGCDATGTNPNSNVHPKYSDGSAYFRFNNTVTFTGTANANAKGHYLANRSDASNVQGYKNAVDISDVGSTNGTLQNVNAAILAANNTAVGVNFGGGYQTTMASFGGSLSGTDVTNFYNRLRTYMTAVGVP